MAGRTDLLLARLTNKPKNPKTKRRGKSHHFLCSLIKANISFNNLKLDLILDGFIVTFCPAKSIYILSKCRIAV